MSITSSVEPYASVSAPVPFFEPEEETVIPAVSLGYSHPPVSLESLESLDRIDQGAPTTPGTADDDALFDAAIGAHRRQTLLWGLAASGLTLGVLAALLS